MEFKIISNLQEFGFTKNEAKAYLTLLKNSPSTGYEISNRSGVPRSAIYDVLRRLELNGMVSVDGEKPVKYIPVSPEKLSTDLTSRFEHNLHELSASMSQLVIADKVEETWNIKGYTSLIEQARSLIDSADTSVFCSLWNREYSQLKEQFYKANKRGVKCVCFSFTKILKAVDITVSYGIDEDQLRHIWNREIVLLVDKKYLLLGGADKTLENRSICTSNFAIINIATNYLILDITLYSQKRNENMDDVMELLMNKNTEGLEKLIL